MNTALWIVQGLLALIFLAFGLMKLTQPHEKLIQRAPFARDFPLALTRLIGLLEVLAAVGLIAPVGTGILPWLTPLAAIGIILTMVSAAAVHVKYGEPEKTVVNGLLLLLAAFVAYGRWAAPL